MAAVSLSGVWKRAWIRRSGVTTDSLLVRYLQSPTWFGDVRIPHDRPRFAQATSFADLSDHELAILATQRGFFGITTIDGDVATWRHHLDFQPDEAGPDIGRIERLDGGNVLEHALDGSFVEHWSALSSGDAGFLTIQIMRGARLHRMLVVVGDHFIYARNRAVELPAAGSLEEIVAAADRATAIGYLDCELSYGVVRGGRAPWTIEHSTLPWREGTRLDVLAEIAIDATGAVVSRESLPVDETWSVPVNTIARDDLHRLISNAP